MMATKDIREQLHQQIDRLPDEMVEQIADFTLFVMARRQIPPAYSDWDHNFGQVMEQALTQDDVIVERYGEPRVAILSYRRYQQLLQLEQGAAGVYSTRPQDTAAAKEEGQAPAEEVR